MKAAAAAVSLAQWTGKSIPNCVTHIANPLNFNPQNIYSTYGLLSSPL
jgi:hypothetical protein